MDVQHCRKCNQYRWIKGEGLCRSCFNSRYRTDEFDIPYSQQLSADADMIAFGAILSGRSDTTVAEILYGLTDGIYESVYIVDAYGVYSEFTSYFDGTTYTVRDSDMLADVFAIPSVQTEKQLQNKIQTVYEVIIQHLAYSNITLERHEKKIIKSVIEETYNRNGVTAQSTNIGECPTYDDMIELVNLFASRPDKLASVMDEEIDEDSISAFLHLVADPLLRFQYGCGNCGISQIPDDKIVTIDVSTLRTSSVGVLNRLAMETAYQKAQSGDGNTLVCVNNITFSMLKTYSEIDSLLTRFSSDRVSNGTTVWMSVHPADDVEIHTHTNLSNIALEADRVRLHDLYGVVKQSSLSVSEQDVLDDHTGVVSFYENNFAVENVSVSDELLDDVTPS